MPYFVAAHVFYKGRQKNCYQMLKTRGWGDGQTGFEQFKNRTQILDQSSASQSLPIWNPAGVKLKLLTNPMSGWSRISQTQDRANCTKSIKDPSFYRRETFLNVFCGAFVPTLELAPSLSAGLPLIQFQSRSRKSEERETHKVRLPQPPPYHLYSSSHTLFF